MEKVSDCGPNSIVLVFVIGFKRHGSFTVLARNIPQIGVKIRENQLALLK